MKDKIDLDKLKSAVLLLSLDSRARKVLDDLDIEDGKSVATLTRLLQAGVVSVDRMGRLLAKLQDAGATLPQESLEELAAAVRAHP